MNTDGQVFCSRCNKEFSFDMSRGHYCSDCDGSSHLDVRVLLALKHIERAYEQIEQAGKLLTSVAMPEKKDGD